MSADPTLEEFEGLSVPEKILRLQDLWDEIAADPDSVELTEAQRAELSRRLQAHREGSGTSSPWSEVRQRIRDAR